MCKVRIIVKSVENEILHDYEQDFSGVDMNQIDRPSFIVVVPSENEINITFSYYDDKETYVSYNEKDWLLEYADGTGRIRKFQGKPTFLHETDKFNIQNKIGNNTHPRAKMNMEASLRIIMSLCSKFRDYRNAR